MLGLGPPRGQLELHGVDWEARQSRGVPEVLKSRTPRLYAVRSSCVASSSLGGSAYRLPLRLMQPYPSRAVERPLRPRGTTGLDGGGMPICRNHEHLEPTR